MRKLLFIILLLTSNSVWADVKAFLNQDTYYEGDPITLTLEASGDISSKNNKKFEPNLTPLNKDFQILGTSTSTQINILNGFKTTKKSWTIELQPRRKGQFQIPAIRIGKLSTAPVNLNIINIPPAVEKETKKHIFVESSVDIAGERPYVQQQIPYTVKLYYDSSMQNGKIYSPTVENAVVEQLGEDRRYRTIRMGKKYSVVEKHFVISPEKSGTLHIPPTTVKGRIAIADKSNPNQNRRRRGGMDTDFLNRFFNNSPFGNDPFFKDFGGDFFSSGRTASKPFTTSSEAIDVIVQPLPQAFTGKLWLPAEELTIEDSWTMSPPELRVGEPVTRVLRLQAKGLSGSQIPDIDIPKPLNIRIYPEQAKPETRTDGKTVYGISEMSITYIPDAEGKVSIPEIKLDWWNVVTKKQETFILPKWDLNVARGANGNAPPAIITMTNTAPEKQTQNTESTSALENSTTGKASTPPSYSTLNWLISIFALLLAAVLAYTYMHKQRPNKIPAQAENINTIKTALQQACEENDQHQAAKQLLRLVNASWKGNNPPQNLGSLATGVTQGKDAILKLERSLYAESDAQWNGSHLWNAVKNGLQVKSASKIKLDTNGLKPLYPSS